MRRSDSLNSYITFQPRGPKSRRSWTTAWKKQRPAREKQEVRICIPSRKNRNKTGKKSEEQEGTKMKTMRERKEGTTKSDKDNNNNKYMCSHNSVFLFYFLTESEFLELQRSCGGVDKLDARERIRREGTEHIRSKAFRRLVRHLDCVLQHRNGKVLRRIRRQPQSVVFVNVFDVDVFTYPL